MYSIPVELIRQYLFCPRIVYFRENLNFNPTYTKEYVKQGRQFHIDLNKKHYRRTLHHYGLDNGKLHQNQYLRSNEHGIHGYCDAVIETMENINIVEFKLTTNKLYTSHIMQGMAYGLMAQEQFNKPLNKIFISNDKKQKLITVNNTPEYMDKLKNIINNIHHNVMNDIFPNTHATTAQCEQCEFLVTCNDRF